MKGFIKSYAEFLGLDSAVILEKLGDALGEKKERETKEEDRTPGPARNYKRYVVAGIIILSLLIVIAVTRLLITSGTEEIPAPTPPPTQADVEKTATTNITSHGIFTTAPKKLFKALTAAPSTDAVPSQRAEDRSAETIEIPAAKYTLLITARELTWLRITRDNGKPVEVVMKKGETATWVANEKLTVLTENAGGVELTLNGEPMGIMGPSGKIVTREFPE